MNQSVSGVVQRVALDINDDERCAVTITVRRMNMAWDEREPERDLIALNLPTYRAPRIGSSVIISWDDERPDPSSNSGR